MVTPLCHMPFLYLVVKPLYLLCFEVDFIEWNTSRATKTLSVISWSGAKVLWFSERNMRKDQF